MNQKIQMLNVRKSDEPAQAVEGLVPEAPGEIRAWLVRIAMPDVLHGDPATLPEPDLLGLWERFRPMAEKAASSNPSPEAISEARALGSRVRTHLHLDRMSDAEIVAWAEPIQETLAGIPAQVRLRSSMVSADVKRFGVVQTTGSIPSKERPWESLPAFPAERQFTDENPPRVGDRLRYHGMGSEIGVIRIVTEDLIYYEGEGRKPLPPDAKLELLQCNIWRFKGGKEFNHLIERIGPDEDARPITPMLLGNAPELAFQEGGVLFGFNREDKWLDKSSPRAQALYAACGLASEDPRGILGHLAVGRWAVLSGEAEGDRFAFESNPPH